MRNRRRLLTVRDDRGTEAATPEIASMASLKVSRYYDRVAYALG
jgi:hypothetical protein